MTLPDLTTWVPGTSVVRGRLDAWPVAALSALLDLPAPAADEGDPLPLLWHGLHLLDAPPQAALGEDGHPAAGPFLPPLPDRRRMVAGGRVRQHHPLRVGDDVERRSSVSAVQPKRGRSGVMLLVTTRHELVRDGVVCVVEEQDHAYRSQSPGQERPLPAGPPDDGPADLVLVPDEALLFRFSALTYNTHRIHYDQPYVTSVEGYPGLVVHGPLLALLLLELPRRAGASVTAYEYRLHRPVFAGDRVAVRATREGTTWRLSAGAPDAPAVIGTAGSALRGGLRAAGEPDVGPRP